MELRKATRKDLMKVCRAIGYKTNLPYIRVEDALSDFLHERMYVVAEEEKVFATVSLVPEPDYGYTAIKRLCILNKKNQGKGIARFAIREIQKVMTGKIGATPWEDNYSMRHILESEGFKLEYKFTGNWCFYSREI
jgi:hypothetical protein